MTLPPCRTSRRLAASGTTAFQLPLTARNRSVMVALVVDGETDLIEASAKSMGSLPELAGCPCTGYSLDRLIQPAILVVLAEQPLHGYGIAERIGRLCVFGECKPDVSGVYRFLKEMESRGMVTFSWQKPQGGPARKAYQITDSGRRCLQQWIETLKNYRHGISLLLKSAQQALAE
ncbi:MAG: PadR family transcriptional regulator [Planctomycetes bacterium]|nr:PadR family transcriptional regulator [Planctomycetota bacterium]